MSQQNHDLKMFWTARTLSFVCSSASSNPGRSSYDVKILNNLFLTIASRSNCSQKDHGLFYLGLLKSGKVKMESTIDQGNLRKILGDHCQKLTLIVKNIFSAERCILQGTKKLFTKERGNPIQRMSRERLILKSSWEVTQQNLLTKSRTKNSTEKNVR